MAALKRNRGTWFLILALGAGLFFLRERRGMAAGDLIISSPMTFASLDGSPADADGIADGVLTVTGNLTIASGGSITCNDPVSPATDSACPIHVSVGGNLEIQAGGSIVAENTVGTGDGGDIELIVAGNTLLRGGSPGAFVSSSKNSGAAPNHAGNITIRTGNFAFPLAGDFTMESGATIFANSNQTAGAISIEVTRSADIEGVLQSRGTQIVGGPSQSPGGGPISVIAGCSLRVGDTGVLSSEGTDAGADLVHLEACDVVLEGLAQSSGPGHAIPNNPPNHCGPSNRNNKPANSTACVEIWAGQTITIDATGSHSGQINADVGQSGGTTGTGWIDIFGRGDVTILGGTSNYAVHANMALANGRAGDVRVVSHAGRFSAAGLAVQATDAALGSAGGRIDIEAGGAGGPGGNVSFGAASIQALGAASGGGSQAGGHIFGRSFNAALTGSSPGSLDASGGSGPNVGSVDLWACTGVSYTGSVTPVPSVVSGLCGGSPTLPNYVVLSIGCSNCTAVSPTPTETATSSPTPAATNTLTQTPTKTPTPTNTPTASATSTPPPTNTPTATPVPTACNADVSGSADICQGSSTTIQAALTGTGPWTLTWSDGFTQAVSASPATRIVSPGATTTYTVASVTGPNCAGGATSGKAKVVVNPLPSSAITAPASVCNGSTGNKASVANAGGQATYAWSITNGTITSGNGTKAIKFSVTGVPGSDVTITVTVTSPGGCASTTTITIPINC